LDAAVSAILSIDQGTSGTKAIVVDPARGILSIAEEVVRPTYLPDGGVEQDPHGLLRSVLAAGRAALDAADVTVGAVSLANQGETVLAWNPADGVPLSPAIVWQDRRAEQLCAELATERDWVAQRSGLVLDPYFSAPKMAWLRRNVTRAGVVTTTDTWLVHQLTGEFVTDASTASRSLILNIDSVDWDPDLLALFGLEDERLPRIVPSDQVIGTTNAFGASTPVAGLIVDQQAALLAEGCLTPGTAKCTFGTGAFLLANAGGQAPRSHAGLTTSVAWQVRAETSYCLDGQVYTAGSAVRWLHTLGLIANITELDSAAGPDAAGVLCVPALAGLAAPWWRSDATASFTGLTLSTEPHHLVRAVVDGIAAQVAELAELVQAELGRPLTRMRVDGGLTRSTCLMQATADLLQIPLDVYPSPHATALGAASLARMAIEANLAIDDSGLDWQPTTTYEPLRPATDARTFRERWRASLNANLPAEGRA
jgi:glycerol kinase